MQAVCIFTPIYVTAYIIFEFRVRMRNNENQFADAFTRASNAAQNCMNVLKFLSLVPKLKIDYFFYEKIIKYVIE